MSVTVSIEQCTFQKLINILFLTVSVFTNTLQFGLGQFISVHNGIIQNVVFYSSNTATVGAAVSTSAVAATIGTAQ